MVTVYDMASGVLHRAKTDSPDDVTNGSQDHSRDTGLPDFAPRPEEQLALQLQVYPETTQDTADKIPVELASIDAEQFISEMEK
ncbi:MAG: hypothetical protein KAR30_09975 [Gammaproteobacteria bacterium]|nr:hypothetical protein [Gammaproteobacteria bacterium]